MSTLFDVNALYVCTSQYRTYTQVGKKNIAHAHTSVMHMGNLYRICLEYNVSYIVPVAHPCTKEHVIRTYICVTY